MEVVEGSVIVEIWLPTNKYRFLDWKISKKLLPGSLVILSHDNFLTIFVGLIKNRNANEMNETHRQYGYVSINIDIVKSTAAGICSA